MAPRWESVRCPRFDLDEFVGNSPLLRWSPMPVATPVLRFEDAVSIMLLLLAAAEASASMIAAPFSLLCRRGSKPRRRYHNGGGCYFWQLQEQPPRADSLPN